MCTINILPSTVGTYLIILELNQNQQRVIGKLGKCEFSAGCYAYVGSAQGSGGLAGRLKRHLGYDKSQKPHWHIDHLNQSAAITQIWWLEGSPSQECIWANILADLGLRSIPNFGSSDCRCSSHLFWLPKMPDSEWSKFMETINDNLKTIKF